MKSNNIKALVAVSEFLNFQVDPEELTEILDRASRLEDNARDREILESLSNMMKKAMK